MVEAMIDKNLLLYRNRAIKETHPLDKWQYKILDYTDRETYIPITDWADYSEGVTFKDHKTCVMKTSFTPRKPLPTEEAYLNLQIPRNCEAFVSIDGVRYAGIDNNTQRCKVYLEDSMYDRELSLELEIYVCTFCDAERTLAPINAPAYIIADKALADFSYIMDFVRDLIKHIKNDYTKAKVNTLFENAIRKSDLSLDYAEFRENAIAIHKDLLDGLKALKLPNDDCIIDCVASTHIDVAWLWRFKDTIRKAGRSALNQLRLMDRYDEFEFSLSQPSVYNYIKEVYPDIFEQIRKRVADGRWRLVGPMWVESDLNISGAESLVREFLYGHQFFKKEFGRTSDVCWIPDSFGFPASLPQIFTKCGMKSFYTTKVRWQNANEFPYNAFIWEGLDGSNLYATIPITKECYNNSIDNENVRLVSDKLQQKDVWDHALMSYGYGDGGGGVTDEMLRNYRLLQISPGMPEVKITKAEDYFTELDKRREKLPVWKGELCVETHQGTYTTIADVKRNNRYIEMAFRRLDLLSVLANLKGKTPGYEETVSYWKKLLLCQFHDVLPGSSIDTVYDDAEKIYKELFAFAQKKEKQLVADTLLSAGEDKITVYNPNSFCGSAYIKIDKKFEGCALTDGETTSNVITDADGCCLFFVENLAGFTTRTYEKTVPVEKMNALTVSTANGKIFIDSPHFSFVVYEDGTLNNFFDKRADRFVGDKLNNIITYKDGPEHEDAWNIDKEYKQRPVDMKWENSVEFIDKNEQRVTVRITKKHNNTILTQDIIAYANLPRVDIVSHIDWQEKYKILQASFPVNVLSTQASYEIAYGIVKRNTHSNTPAEKWKHEYAAHRFTDLSDDAYGVSILNDCKYGHNIIDNDMIMTLLRNTDNPARFRDTGEHDFAYSILPHIGGLSAGRVVQEGYLFNSPFIVFEGSSEEKPVLSLSNEGLIVDCIKPAEDGNGFIARMYEPYGLPGKTVITVDGNKKITEVTPLEEYVGDCSGEITYKPFEIKTLRIF
ncbi:MAG: alpha-mannosidase [Clostridia bacterium]|nr:alpha-mannosidase [Clostridia bacterium]